jgi:hypothetical protein
VEQKVPPKVPRMFSVCPPPPIRLWRSLIRRG